MRPLDPPPKLDAKLQRFRAKLEATIAKIDGIKEVQVHLKSDHQSQIATLNLEALAVKHCVDLRFVVEALQQRYCYGRRQPGTLGVAINFLYSAKVWDYVAEQVSKTFPTGENQSAFHDAVKSRVLPQTLASNCCCVEEYQSKIESNRKYCRRLEKRFRRPWRNNPWR